MAFKVIKRVRGNIFAMVAVTLLAVSPSSVSGQAGPRQSTPPRPQPGGPVAGGQGQPSGTPAPEFVEVLLESGQMTRLQVSTIRKASTGPIKRLGMDFPFTPLTAVMKAAGIAPRARIRVTAAATGETLTLQRGGSLHDPEHFGFIFNLRGWPVLTPRPGTPPARALEPSNQPQVRDATKIEVVKDAQK